MLVVRGLTRQPLGPVDLDLARGEILFLSGPSGSGKSLLLRSLADLDPHEGEIRLDDDEQAQVPPPLWRRRVAYLPPEASWWLPRVGDLLPATVDDAALASLGLDPALREASPERLSSGESQRLALLRLLAQDPELLLLDEPSANLDPESTAKLEALIIDRRAARDLSVIWVSHDPLQSARVADRHLELQGGGFTS